MAKTLLNGVNEVLKRANMLKEGGLLTTLTEDGIQPSIDLAVQVWNEQMEELYSSSHKAQPQEVTEGTITLLTGDRDYTLPADMNQIRWPLHDETNGNYIVQWPGGYEELRNSQHQPANHTGMPSFGAISPIDKLLYLDRIPTAAENGNVYVLFYDKDLELSLAADTMPFDDDVFRAMVPAVYQIWRREKRQDFDPKIFNDSFGRAARRLTKNQMRSSWLPA